MESIRTDFNLYDEEEDENYAILTLNFERRKDAAQLATALIAEPNLDNVELSPEGGRWEVSVSYKEDESDRMLVMVWRVLAEFFDLEGGKVD